MARKRAAPVVEPEPSSSSSSSEEVEEEVEVEEEDEEEVEEEIEEEVEEEEYDEDQDDDSEEAEEDAGKDENRGGQQGKGQEGTPEASLRESVRQLLDPFGKDQLIDFLKEAVRKNPALWDNISSSAESDPTHRKIFVHGLSWDATTEILATAFRGYGEIEECRVVSDRVTGKSKGYGFVLFRTRAGAQNALKEPQKKVGNRMAACQLASYGPVPTKKIFPGTVGLNQNLQGATAQGVGGLANAALQPTNLPLTSSLVGAANPIAGAVNQNVYPAAAGLAAQQSTRVGGLNPTASAVGLSSTLNRSGSNPPFGAGLTYAGASQGINSISPSVIANYNSQAALQGLGGYQSSQLPTSTGIRSHATVGSLGPNLTHYFGR